MIGVGMFEQIYRVLFITVLGFFVSACQPTYTGQQTEHYARKIGLIDQFEITRWHNYILPRTSSIVVAAKITQDIASETLLKNY